MKVGVVIIVMSVDLRSICVMSVDCKHKHMAI